LKDTTLSYDHIFTSADTISGDNGNGILDVGETWTWLVAGGAAAAGWHDNVADVSGSATEIINAIPTPTTTSGEDFADYFGINAHLTLDKQTTGNVTPTTTGTGDDTSFNILAGYGVTWTYKVTNDGNVDLSSITVTDNPTETIAAVTSLLHTFNIGDLNNDHILNAAVYDSDGVTLISAAETWTYTATGTAQLGAFQNTATATADKITDDCGHDIVPTDDDSSGYTGTFTEQGGTLTQGFWGSHTDAWDNIASNEGNPTKSAYASHVLSSLDVNPSTNSCLLLGDTNHNGIADDAHDLWISIKLAATIESSSTSGDARVIMLQQAIAAQLNIDNGKAEPNDLIDEAVMWLTKQGAWSGVGVNVGSAPVSNGFGGTVSTVAENGSHTALAGSSVATSSAAWHGYVDVVDGTQPWEWDGNLALAGNQEADGEGLKNALMWWNDGHLVTTAAGQVAYDTNGTAAGGINPATINLNTLDEFWLTLHQQTGLTGIA
jgi:hypothetical protein